VCKKVKPEPLSPSRTPCPEIKEILLAKINQKSYNYYSGGLLEKIGPGEL